MLCRHFQRQFSFIEIARSLHNFSDFVFEQKNQPCTKMGKCCSFKLFDESTSCTWVKVLTILAVIYSILTYLLHRPR